MARAGRPGACRLAVPVVACDSRVFSGGTLRPAGRDCARTGTDSARTGVVGEPPPTSSPPAHTPPAHWSADACRFLPRGHLLKRASLTSHLFEDAAPPGRRRGAGGPLWRTVAAVRGVFRGGTCADFRGIVGADGGGFRWVRWVYAGGSSH